MGTALWNNKDKVFHKTQFFEKKILTTLVGKKGQTNSGGVINVAAKVRAAHNNVTSTECDIQVKIKSLDL